MIYGDIESKVFVHEVTPTTTCNNCVQSFIKIARLGCATAVQKLLEPDSKATFYFYKPFHEACSYASWRWDTDVMKVLLQAAHNDNPRLYISTMLELATQREQHEEVVRLNKAKKYLKEVHTRKIRLFHDAAGSGDIEFAKFLVGIEADVNAKLYKIDLVQSALATAATRGHLDMVKFLLSKGLILNSPSHPHIPYWSIMDRTPLRAAPKGGFLEVVEVLLQAGADVIGHVVLKTAASRGHLLVAMRLLEAGADVNLGIPLRYGEDKTAALQMAAHGGHIDMIEILLKANANVSGAALYFASGQGFIVIVKRLIAAGANVNAWAEGMKYHGNETALHGASRMGELSGYC